MGQKLSLLAPSAPTVAVSSYVDALHNYQYVEVINNSRFLKTIKAIDKTTGNLVIIKLLIKPASPNYSIQLQQVIELMVKQSSLLYPFKNALPWHRLIETDRAGYVVRQMIKTNLYDRLSIRPFLEPIEKLFITYQILKIINEIHSLNIHHGDLKLENFLITSWNWLLLSDFSNLLKPTYIPEDNPNQYSFYFDTSGRRLCYIAPERFYNSQDHPKHILNFNDDGLFTMKNSVTDAMDLFSTGCVIAELYNDGEPTFTLSQLFKFMKNEYTPDLSGIYNKDIVTIIGKLIKLDPNERSSAREILDENKGTCFPEFFYSFLYDFMEMLNNQENFVLNANNDNISISDMKISYIYDNFGLISKLLKFQYSMDESNFSRDDILPMKLNLETMPFNYRIKQSKFIDDDLQEAALILLNVVTSFSQTLKQVNSKIKCCELIVALSERIRDESKLDRAIPYLCLFLDEYIEGAFHQQEGPQTASKVVCMALYSLTTLLMSCSYINPINMLIFPEYILPKIYNLLTVKSDSSSQRLVNCAVAVCLPYLAATAKRFWIMSKAFKNTNNALSTLVSPEDAMQSFSNLSLTKDQLDLKFKEITILLLTDSESPVKISLLNNILPLCQFFGQDKTNDIILPHLISYLNDTDQELRLAFLSSVLQMGPFIGVLSFEQYILPLLVQTIGDGEQFVVLKVLEIFNMFVKERLINPRTEFNALDVYKELLLNSINLLLHPNEWIRQSVINLIISVSANLTDADKYCFLYPLIKRFLSYDLSIIDWNTLYPCLTKPLTKQIYDLAITWSLNSTSKSLFWQQKNFSMLTTKQSGNNITKKMKKLISFNKDMGKSVYLPQMMSELTFANGSNQKSNLTIPLSLEDKQWLLKLKSIGLDDKSLWKILALRDYIYHVGRSPTSTLNKRLKATTNEILILPRNIFFTVVYRSEPLSISNGTREERILGSNAEETVSIRTSSRRGSNSLILPQLERVTASVQTVEANVMGEMETHNSGVNKDGWFNDSNTSHKVFSVSNSKIIVSHIKHTYTGENPYILNFLKNPKFQPNLSDFEEFGKTIIKHQYLQQQQQQQNQNQQQLKTIDMLPPMNVLVASFRSSDKDNRLEEINALAVCPTSEFFVTGSSTGSLKVWDSLKMEKLVTVKNANLSIELNSSICSITFLPNRFVVIVTTNDGTIRLFRIDVIRNSKSKKIVRYLKMHLIRKYIHGNDHDGSGNCNGTKKYHRPIEQIKFLQDNYIIGVDATEQKIIMLDIITMTILSELQHPLIYGIINTFIVYKDYWLLVGTDKGVLTLWDLRFKIIVKSWHVKNNENNEKLGSINNLELLSNSIKLFETKNDGGSSGGSGSAYFALSGNDDISIWELPSLECKAILRTSNAVMNSSSIMKYSLIEYKDDGNDDELFIEKIIDDIELDIDHEYDRKLNLNVLTMKFFQFNTNNNNNNVDYLMCSTGSNRVILFNLTSIQDSVVLKSDNTMFNTRYYNNVVIIDPVFANDQTLLNGTTKTNTYNVVKLVDHLFEPFHMIITIDRNNCVKLYKAANC